MTKVESTWEKSNLYVRILENTSLKLSIHGKVSMYMEEIKIICQNSGKNMVEAKYTWQKLNIMGKFKFIC